MSLEHLVATTVVVLGFLLVGLAVLMAVQRSSRRWLDGRRDASRRRLRAQVLEQLLGAEGAALDLKRGDRRMLARLAGDLSDKVTGDIRHDLARLLADLGLAERAVRRARSRRPERRANALHLLGVVAPVTPEARSIAERALDDPALIVRATAVRTLGRREDPLSAPALIASLDNGRDVPVGLVVHALLAMGAAVTPVLIDALDRSGPHGRSTAVELLGHLGSVDAVPALLEVLEDDPVLAIRAWSAYALGSIGSPRAREALLNAMSRQHPVELRAAAARALGRLGDPRAVPWLVEGLDDASVEVAAACGRALTNCGEAGIGRLEAIGSAGSRAADHAAAALGEHQVLLAERARTASGAA